MTVALVVALLLVTGLLAVLLIGGAVRRRRQRRRDAPLAAARRRILFPFLGQALSTSALDAALRISRVEGAVLVPAYLAVVPRSLPLASPLPAECRVALPLLEAIEHRAAGVSVAVEARIERGRSSATQLASCSRPSATTVSSSPPTPATGTATASVPTTSPGCCASRRARSWSSVPPATSASSRPLAPFGSES